MAVRDGVGRLGDVGMIAMDNRAVCEQLNVNTFNAHALLKKFGKMVGRRRVIMEKTLERLIEKGTVYIDEAGGVYF